MKILQAFKMAIRSITAKKVRAVLTMLGIIIGVASVVIMVSVVQGSNKKMLEYFERMGNNKVSVYLYGRDQKVVKPMLYDYCARRGDLIAGITPEMDLNMHIIYGARNTEKMETGGPRISLGNENYSICNNFQIGKGRDLSYLDSKLCRNVVVLGAQVYSAERMGVSLAGRVEKAGEYLLSHPQAKVIVTGGQGADEPCPESLTQRNALVAQGVEEDRIFQEDRSHNTRQNLEYAMDIAQEEGLGTEFVVVTQEFHMFRALQLAETAGFTAYSLTAQSDPLLLPEYYGRELLSLTKWMVERQFLG